MERDARRGLRQRGRVEAFAEDAVHGTRGAACSPTAIVESLALPPIFALAVCDNALAPALAADPRVALVSFTGSSAVGRDVAQTVATRFGKTLLECAGNNAIIVTADADPILSCPR